MCKALVLVALLVVSSVSAGTRTFNIRSKHIERARLPLKTSNNGIDWCPQCINTYGDLIELVLDVILQYGVMNTCGELCDLVAEKSGSSLLGFLCTFGCDILGIEEFVKIIDKADIDPIYYCERIKVCPINDNGDAKFKSFVILPPHGPQGTTFSIDFVYVSNNGTGTGELIIAIKTVDKVPLSASFLVEAQKPGTYGERVSVDASPDPDCDPTQDECESWVPGTYNVTVLICNGQCGSHHPHTQLYDTATGLFVISE
ncbi:unnamed protein product [Rotaria magnacalcarata]|uniref:Countin-1 n=2 Tax=Rotaria magnacalcarata TaxID=392030 RepID=A0A819JCH8_9BILA|nr:unnamed protein product [Rotaria magnacalcarata]CAF1485400.1 unnamed protein product [Rotaria magnacalcarata]CAF1923519.1 unnamed protein product [Rotaria magnacalcarata]CAF2119794.1 unnamed protein product [Rotaria magnacalcarata]CAF3930763.1 unnamed protein product [Rotaria magnacalcarata]